MADQYPDGINLKEITQHCRDILIHAEFDNSTLFSIDFANDFFRRSEKRKFYSYLVELILQKYSFHDKIVFATKNEKFKINVKGSLTEVEMSECSSKK